MLPLEIEGEEYALLSFALPQPELPSGLTAAEQEVVKAVVRGESNREIAKGRGVSTNTVANQLRAVYGKLGVNTRHELVALCTRSSLAVAARAARF
jgi:DNA-binding CsgD family transcriptional regulator